MNLKLSSKDIRLRISKEECGLLLNQKSLIEQIKFEPLVNFQISIQLTQEDDQIEFSKDKLSLMLNHINLLNLFQNLSKKNSAIHFTLPFKLMFEIDIF